MKYFAMLSLVMAATLALLSNSFAQREEPGQADADQVQSIMQRKLTHAQKILEGLANEDYAKIAQNSQQISLLSLDSSWQVLQTPEYVDHSADFRQSADRMTSAALAKNIDGATLAYVEMTMKCVHCHKYLRSAR